MLNTSSMALTSPLSTAQKAARNLIFKCLQRMEIGTLTVIESFQSDTQERSETLCRYPQSQAGCGH